MDPKTLEVYNQRAAELCSQYRATTPEALYRLISAFFHPGEESADVGCGCGRDTAWLEEQGFPTIGCDPSPAMLGEARAAYPHLRHVQSGLPDLAGQREGVFSNVLCSATLMHVRQEDIITAVMGLDRLLVPEGRLIISWRAGRAGQERHLDRHRRRKGPGRWPEGWSGCRASGDRVQRTARSGLRTPAA